MASFEFPQMKYHEQKGLVSIIVPIYNTGTLLRECLDSILAQTFTNWEAILVDDGSTDGTGKIADEYGEKDSRFVVIHKQNEGTLLARKTGLENSKGEFIANIDHDDAYHAKFLEKMHEKITEANADFAYCGFQMLNDDNYCIDDYFEWSSNAIENIEIYWQWSKLGFSLWNKLIKREVYAKVCFPNKNIVNGEDPVQMFQIVYHSKSVASVSEVLYFHKVGGASSEMSSVAFIRATMQIYETVEKVFNYDVPQNMKNILYKYGHAIFCDYFLLNKEQNQALENEFGSLLFLTEFIKWEKRLSFKILLLLASKGIKFPLRLRLKLRNSKFILFRIIRKIVRRK
jgi:glycosyltransferase involved in cell wall biosynthesis